MAVTELGTVILVSPVQPEKALDPMAVTELGIVMLVSPAQPENHWIRWLLQSWGW